MNTYLIQTYLQRASANHLKNEGRQHVKRQNTLAREVGGALPMLRDEFWTAHLLKNIFENLA